VRSELARMRTTRGGVRISNPLTRGSVLAGDRRMNLQGNSTVLSTFSTKSVIFKFSN